MNIASWHPQLKEELSLPYMRELDHFLKTEEQQGQIYYPPRSLIFNAFAQTPLIKSRS